MPCGLQVRKREQEVASMRDASYDAKDAARNARLRVKYGLATHMLPYAVLLSHAKCHHHYNFT